MVQLFRRAATVQVDKHEIRSTVEKGQLTGFDFAFEIERTLKRSPNKAQVELWNIGEDLQYRLLSLEKVFVSVSAGYVDNETLLFAGDLSEVSIRREGPDVITTVSAGDGLKAAQSGRVSMSFGANVSFKNVVKQVGNKLKEQIGGVGGESISDKLSNFANAIRPEKLAQTFSNGLVVHGNTVKEFESLLDSAGYEFSIQNGQVQILEKGKSRRTRGALLSYDTGLLSAPEKSSEGIARAQCLLIPGIEPGDGVEFSNVDTISGVYRVTKAVYTGSTFSEIWQIDIEAKEQKSA